MKDSNKIGFKKSSGNVYQDLGLSNPVERQAKAKLAMRINDIIAKRNLKQAEAADILGINQPKISALANGKLDGFSMERLINFLNLLDQDVDIIINSKPGRRTTSGRLRIGFDSRL